MIVVDIETSGTDPYKHSIASIGAIDFYNPENKFDEECRIWDGAHIDPDALKVNGYKEKELKDSRKITEKELLILFFDWLSKREERTIAGQNPHFDIRFLEAAAHRYHLDFRIAHREIDLHSIVYFHMVRRGITPPTKNNHSGLNSDEIMKYVGIPDEPKPHKAINGAVWEAEALSRLMFEVPLLTKFGRFVIPWLNDAK